MKHIKRFNENKIYIEDIEDILLELRETSLRYGIANNSVSSISFILNIQDFFIIDPLCIVTFNVSSTSTVKPLSTRSTKQSAIFCSDGYGLYDDGSVSKDSNNLMRFIQYFLFYILILIYKLMKYLKLYEEINYHEEGYYMDSEEVERIFTPMINWNLINDVKDMSLELIDWGYYLTIFVYRDGGSELYKLNFDHTHNETKWFELHGYRNAYLQPNQDISYRISLDTDPDFDWQMYLKNKYFNSNFFINKKENDMEDLLGRVRETYPNEKIGKYEEERDSW